MKRESSRAVIIDNNRVLTMFRRKIDELKNKNFQRMDVVNKAINKKYE